MEAVQTARSRARKSGENIIIAGIMVAGAAVAATKRAIIVAKVDAVVAGPSTMGSCGFSSCR